MSCPTPVFIRDYVEKMEETKLSKQSVVGIGLDWKMVKSVVFDQISNDKNNIFVSQKTKDSLLEYSKTETYKDAKKVWKNLLIDSIFLLKINDSREKLYSEVRDLFHDNSSTFNTKFETNFNNIRKLSTFGIDELGEYFDDFVNFESVLYGTGEYYRDHIHHVLQVWGVGLSLIYGSNPIATIKLGDKFIYDGCDFHFQIEKNRPKTISRSELWSMWTIIALCHDLGYPLEKASQINQQVRKIVNHFGTLNFNELNYNFDLLNSFLVDKYLKIVSSKAKRASDICQNGEDCDDANGCQDNADHRTVVQSKYHDKFSKSLEEYKHGMLSGLLIFKKLTYFLETDYALTEQSLSCEDLRQFFIRKEILRAICGHTCPKIYHINLNTLPFLLILCDELQESGRPRFEELLLGKKDDSVTSKINEFWVDNSEARIDLEIEYKEIVILGAQQEKVEKIEKGLIRKKFQHFHYLLRSAKKDKGRNVKFIMSLIFTDQRKYSFHFNSKEISFDMMIESYSEDLSGNGKGKKKPFDLYPDPNI